MNDDELSVSDKSESKKDYPYIFGKHMVEHTEFEPTALYKKLQSKNEALRILRNDLERFRNERDQFKLMAETLQLRYSSVKRYSELSYVGGSNVANLLHETREKNLALTTEVETLKQKLYELQGDVAVLRKKDSIKQRNSGESPVQKPVSGSKEEALWKQERSAFICNLENLKKKNAQLAFDLKTLIDEKEELITERDAFKCKSHRLNHELISALKANESHPKFLDVDGIILENKYLMERIKNLETDVELVTQQMNKYKSMLDAKRKKGIVKLGSDTNEENILSHKQAKAMLDNGIDLPTKTETIQDLRSLCLALLDNLNDKTIALNHQKKTNRMLASKIADLDRRLQTLTGLDQTSPRTSFSPSLLLLNGYSAAEVDANESETTTTEHKESEAENPTTIEAQCCSAPDNNKPLETLTSTTELDSDDGMSSFTSDSCESVASSVYDIDLEIDALTKGAANAKKGFRSSTKSQRSNDPCLQADAPSTADSGHGASSSLLMTNPTNASTPSNKKEFILTPELAQQRENDLKSLPPELAEIVRKALEELDMRDFESEFVLSDDILQTFPDTWSDSSDEDNAEDPQEADDETENENTIRDENL